MPLGGFNTELDESQIYANAISVLQDDQFEHGQT
jgi:hypothetical protein